MKQVILFLLLFLAFNSYAQLPYSQSQFSFTIEENIYYGSAINYAGVSDSLVLDIYKPVGDNNCKRPLMILVHGGAWIAGTKNDPAIVAIAEQMAEKGWVVASIKYRLGTHKAANYDMYWACNNTISAPCGYISDSSEIYRAIYRGMQDAKGAIRFMKSRHNIDSTDINNVFITGESAGGFVALATTFLNDPSEKPAEAFAIPDAPAPDADLVSCNPANTSLARPDLGSLDGTLHLGSYDASVKGVGSIYGGLLDLNIIDPAETTAIYLFHQGSDVVVHYQYGRLLGRTSYECYTLGGNICQPYHFYPFAYGGESIRQYLNNLGAQAPIYQADIINNYSYTNNCLSNGHSIDNITLRVQNIVDLFAPIIAASGNDPSTNCQAIGMEKFNYSYKIYPNPVSNNTFTIESNISIEEIRMYDISGKMIYSVKVDNNKTRITIEKKAGIYLLEILSGNNISYYKIAIN